MKHKKFLVNFLVILIPTLLAGGFAYYMSIRQVPLYRSEARVLVIQDQGEAFDPSSAARSAEKVAANLVQIIPTESFLREVLASGFGVEQDIGGDLSAKREAWRGMIIPSSEGSLITVSSLNASPAAGARVVAASAHVLTRRASLWHGAGRDIVVRTVDPPVTTSQPVSPNVPLNTLAGVLVGLLLSSAALYYAQYFSLRQVRQNLGYASDLANIQENLPRYLGSEISTAHPDSGPLTQLSEFEYNTLGEQSIPRGFSEPEPARSRLKMSLRHSGKRRSRFIPTFLVRDK